MKILILCTYESTYVLQLYMYMKKYYPHIRYSIFTKKESESYYRGHLLLENDEAIYSFGSHDYLCRREARKLPHFEIIHSLWMEQFWGEAADILSQKCDAWLCSVGGSDLYRQSSNMLFKFLQKRIIKHASWISSESEETKQYFEKVYGIKNSETPHTIIRFGVDILDSFKKLQIVDSDSIKKKYGIPVNKTVIMCGTNARKEHQHVEMLEEIAHLSKNLLENCCLLIPMTYGGTEEYINSIQMKAFSITNNSVILKDFLTTDEMAEIAAITDIMVHIQTTDQLSSAMLSHMFCGNIVIAGSWLPYDTLRSKGIEFISIDKISELTEQLEEVISNMEHWKNLCKKNAEIVYKMSSWENSAKEWYYVYDQLIKNERRIQDDNSI